MLRISSSAIRTTATVTRSTLSRSYSHTIIRFNEVKDGASESATSPNEDSAASDISPDSAELIAKLQKEIKDLKDTVIRSYAEEENVRRIAKRDVENARLYANTSFAKAMLDVADNLERALAAVPPEKKKGEDPILNSLVEGIEMTEKNLQKIFGQFGIVKYGADGDKFDPSLHDALFQQPAVDGKESGVVSTVLKTGYKLKDRVIRAAQVGTTA